MRIEVGNMSLAAEGFRIFIMGNDLWDMELATGSVSE